MRWGMLCLTAWLTLYGPAMAETKVALVIGNANYQNAPILNNPRHDAEAVAGLLRSAGFSARNVTMAFDLGYDAMRKALLAFSHEARSADVAIIYFAGHGFGSGVNYLIPVDAALKAAADLPNEAISQRTLEDAVKSARRLKLVIIDACRNDPSQGRMIDLPATRSLHRGLERVEPDSGVMVLYSAKHGTVAMDGPPGDNSPFAKAVLKHLAAPGKDIRFAIGAVRDSVKAATGGEQEPYLYASLGEQPLFLVDGQGRSEDPAGNDPETAELKKHMSLLEEELRRQKARAQDQEKRRAEESERRDREQNQAQDSRSERGDASVCGWYAIHSCSRTYEASAREARKFAGYVINTDDPGFAGFARGWYCSVLGPMDKAGAKALVERAKHQGFPTAYVKNPC